MKTNILNLKNIASLGIINILSLCIGTLISIIAARLLIPKDFGVYAFWLSSSILLTLISSGGLGPYIIKELPKLIHDENLKEIRSTTSSLLLTIFCLYSTLYFFSLALPSWTNNFPFFGSMLLFSLANSLSSLVSNLLKSIGKPLKAELPIQLIQPLFLVLTLAILSIFSELALSSIINTHLFSCILTLLVLLLLLKSEKRVHLLFPSTNINLKTVLKPVSLLTIYSTFTFISSELGILVLGFLDQSEATAGLRIALRLASFTTIPLLAINTIISPKLSLEIHNNNFKHAHIVYLNACRYSFILGFILILIITIFGNHLISVLFGPHYTNLSMTSLYILLFGQFINIASGPISNFMIFLGYEKLVVSTFGISILINLILSIIFIPIFSQAGSAIATASALIFWNLFLLFYAYRKLKLGIWIFR